MLCNTPFWLRVNLVASLSVASQLVCSPTAVFPNVYVVGVAACTAEFPRSDSMLTINSRLMNTLVGFLRPRRPVVNNFLVNLFITNSLSPEFRREEYVTCVLCVTVNINQSVCKVDFLRCKVDLTSMSGLLNKLLTTV